MQATVKPHQMKSVNLPLLRFEPMIYWSPGSNLHRPLPLASMAAASATTAITGSNFKNQSSLQDNGASNKHNGDSSLEKTDCCSEKFAPRFDGLRFIETLVTGHR